MKKKLALFTILLLVGLAAAYLWAENADADKQKAVIAENGDRPVAVATVEKPAPAFALAVVQDSLPTVLAERLTALGARRVAFEAGDVTVETFQKWQEVVAGVEWAATTGVVEGLREIKDAGELAAIERAVAIADRAMEHIYDWVHPGVTEREVAWELEVHMRTHGAERLSFNSIVAAGPRGAMSHACLLYTSPSPRDRNRSRKPSSA